MLEREAISFGIDVKWSRGTDGHDGPIKSNITIEDLGKLDWVGIMADWSNNEFLKSMKVEMVIQGNIISLKEHE